MTIRAPGLEHAHAGIGPGTEPVGEDAAGGTGADDDEVESVQDELRLSRLESVSEDAHGHLQCVT